MSFGSKPKTPTIPTPSPTLTKAPEVTEAQSGYLERLRRMQGRSSTHLVSPGFLVPKEDKRGGLSSTLG